MKLVQQWKGKKYYYLGHDDDLFYYLEEPNFDCDWYWGLNYIEGFAKKNLNDVDDIELHTHFMTEGTTPLNMHGITTWHDWLNKSVKSPLSKSARWKLLELCGSLKTIRDYMDLCHLGRSHYTEYKKSQIILKDKEAYDDCDQKIQEIWQLVVELFDEEQEKLNGEK